MAVALGIMALLLTLFTGGIYYWVLVLVIIWTLFSFMAGSYLEYRRLKAGGRAIAKRVGAVRLFIDSSQEALEHSQGVAYQHEPVSPVRYSSRHIAVRDERDFPPVYRRYYEFAQQLAIASGLSMPILYVMPNEQGINGFVAGRHTQDMVLVVTQGALDKLSDEALYGLIGHEYGHIMHGDAKFNLQLMVVLAGLQILYDWSDPIENLTSGHSRHSSYFDSMTRREASVAQRKIDSQARDLEAKTADFTTHSEWVTHWQTQAQRSTELRKNSALPLPSRVFDRNAPRSVWTLLLQGLSFSSMASAQLIKHSFNRERELLADATSIQLTRSPAILETLKAIHQDSLGSRLSYIADINGLSHFFFASSGADLGDVSWFATHPSLPERMSAINASDYQNFAIKVAKEQQLNQQKIKEIYEQRRSGTWGGLKGNNNLSGNINSSSPSPSSSDIAQKHNISVDKSSNGFDSKVDTDTGLEFNIKADTIIDGRLQVEASAIGTDKLLKPWQTELSPDLPTDTLVSDTDIQNVSLPHYVLDHSHHPLGAQAVIEAVLLCHQCHTLSTTAVYDLADIWCGPCQAIIDIDHNANDDSSYVNHIEPIDINISINSPSALNNENIIIKEKGVLPHIIDPKLLETIASFDRRLDSALLALAVKRLSKHDLSLATIEQLRQKVSAVILIPVINIISNSKIPHNASALSARAFELFKGQLSADLTKNLNDDASETLAQCLPLKPQPPPILSLWQALHLQQLLPVLSQVLGDDGSTENALYQQVLQACVPDIIAQLDPSGQTFTGLETNQQAMLVIFAYRLAKDKVGQTAGFIDNHKCYVIDLRRHARLIDIDLGAVSDANLQWLLVTAQHLNSIQLLAIITLIPTTDENQHKTQQDKGQIVYNGDSHNSFDYNGFNHNNYRLWLSTLHTVMLHDTIVSQDEFDCLTVLAERWLGVRKLFD